jgi:hypothetical protein
MRRLRVLPLALAAVVAVSAIPAVSGITAARASAACNPPRSYNKGYSWAGLGQAPGVNVSGADAEIWNYAPYVPSGQFSYNWVMLSGPAGQANTWAQIGNYQLPNSRSTHVQFYQPDGYRFDGDYAAQPVNHWNYYTVLYNYGNHAFSFQINHQTVQNIWDTDWVPQGAIFSAETTNLNTQMMGAVQDTSGFLNSALYYNGGWHQVTGSPSVSNSNGINVSGYFAAIPPDSFIQTWDRQCTGV